MQVIEVVNAQPILEKIAKAQLPIALSFDLLPLFTQANEVVKLFNERKDNLIREMGTFDEEKNMYSVDEANKAQFEEKIIAYLNEEIELPTVVVPVNTLSDCGVELSIEEVQYIVWMIDNES